MSVKTQGTHLFLIDPTSSNLAVMKMQCPTGIQGVTSGARDQIDDTCLEATEDRSYTAGLGNPGTVTIPFILDPQAASHQALFDLKASGVKTQWLVGLSDGTGTPTANSSGGFEIGAIGRTTIEFTAYVSDLAIDIATNEVVRGTLTLQRSGAYTFTRKAA